MLVSISKVLLKHSHIHAFTYGTWLLSWCTTELRVGTETYLMVHKNLKYSLPGPLQKFYHPCTRWLKKTCILRNPELTTSDTFLKVSAKMAPSEKNTWQWEYLGLIKDPQEFEDPRGWELKEHDSPIHTTRKVQSCALKGAGRFLF